MRLDAAAIAQLINIAAPYVESALARRRARRDGASGPLTEEELAAGFAALRERLEALEVRDPEDIIADAAQGES